MMRVVILLVIPHYMIWYQGFVLLLRKYRYSAVVASMIINYIIFHAYSLEVWILHGLLLKLLLYSALYNKKCDGEA